MKNIRMSLWKPKKFTEMEMEIKKKGYDVKKLINVAIVYYFRNFIDEKIIVIPEEFLNLFEENVYQEEIVIAHNIYMKVHRYVKNVPYSLSDIVSYSLYLYYEKLLQE